MKYNLMKHKRLIGAALAAALVISGGILVYFKAGSKPAWDEKNISVIPYTPAPEQPLAQPGFKITQYYHGEAAGWVGDREMLTLVKKGEYISPATLEAGKRLKTLNPKAAQANKSYVYYVSIYNLDTGKTMEYRNVNLGWFLGISPDRRFVLYEEPKIIPAGEEWEEEMKSGKLLNHSIKILNLVTGEISALPTKYRNKDAGYKWTPDNKLLACYPFEKEWQIMGPEGTVYASGHIDDENYLYVAGTDAEVTDGEASGSIYFVMSETGSSDTWIERIDVKTGEVGKILGSKNFYTVVAQNGLMLKDEVKWDAPGKEERKKVTTVSLFDGNGNVKKDYVFDDALLDIDLSAISPDGKKAALVERVQAWSSKIILLDIETGKTEEILGCNSVENLSWNDGGNMLSFASRPSLDDDAYSRIVSFQ